MTAERLTAAGPKPWLLVLGTALAYALSGLIALGLAAPPSFPSPLYPAAGVALAATLVHGRPALLGVVLGALVVNLSLAGPRGLPVGPALVTSLASAVGAVLQAGFGSWLLRRAVPWPLVLTERGDVARFVVYGALLASMVNATLSTVVLQQVIGLSGDDATHTWWTWWLGDAMGVLIGAPVVLTLIGQPKADWRSRRVTLALPLLLTALLLTLGTVVLARWEEQRISTAFERDSALATASLKARLQHAEHALEALRGLYTASQDVTAAEFQRSVQPWLQAEGMVQALGFSQRVRPGDLARFEAEVRRSDGRSLEVFNRPSASEPLAGSGPGPDASEERIVIRHIEPDQGNARARGLNALSVPVARQAMLQAIRNDAPAATAAFGLTQAPSETTGVVLYRALYQPGHEGDAAPWTPAEREARAVGVVFVTLRMRQVVEASRQGTASYLSWCLSDAGAAPEAPPLVGPAGCREGHASHALRTNETVGFGGRTWRLQLQAARAAVNDPGADTSLLFAGGGLVAVSALTALLLSVTGRARRVEAAVDARTTELRREMAERLRVVQALTASEQRLRNIFDHAPAGIVFAELDGRIREVNPRMCEMVGLPSAELMNEELLAVALPADREALRKALSQMLLGELSVVNRQARLQHRDGSERWVQSSWSLLRDDHGQPMWLVAVIEDITERLKRQEAEQGRQVAESANRAKNEFLSRMSHELRTPLNAMLGFAQLLEIDRRPPLTPHQANWTGQILQAGWHLLEMINDTLDLSRIEAGVMLLQPEPVPLAPLLAQCCALVGKPAAERRVEVSVQLAHGAATVQADPTRLKQVLTNLLSNAVKYNVEGGRVEVRGERLPGGQVALRVEDTGLGLSAEQLAQLFQPFNRLGREQGGTEGTGIGLVISRRLAELMGGRLEAESVPGQGATFVLTLPAAAEPGRPADAPAEPHGGDGVPARRGQRLLYIEDNETNVEVMRGILAQRPRLALMVATRAQEALQMLRAELPDLVLLDMHLPDLDGIDLLREIRALPGAAGLPVLAVSADATPARIEAARAAGAADYLTKPLNVGRTLEHIDRALAGADRSAGTLGMV